MVAQVRRAIAARQVAGSERAEAGVSARGRPLARQDDAQLGPLAATDSSSATDGAGAVPVNSGGSSPMPPRRNPAGGCAVCSRPAVIGTLAHGLVQGLAVAGAGARMIPELMLVTGPEDPDPEVGNGRLDLALSTGEGFGVEIGEIKPYNERGARAGRKDLAWYLEWIQINRPGTPVSFMQTWPGPTQILFIDPKTDACMQVLEVIPGTDGLFFYRCTPNADTIKGQVSGCDCRSEPEGETNDVSDAEAAAAAAAIVAAAAAAARAAAKAAQSGSAGAPAPGIGPLIAPKWLFKRCFLDTFDPDCVDYGA